MPSASEEKLWDSNWNITVQTHITNWLLLQHSGSLTGLLPKPVSFISLPEVARGQLKLNSQATRNSFTHQSLSRHRARDLDTAIPWLGRMYLPVWEEKPWLRTASSASSTFSDKTFLAFYQVATYVGKELPSKATQSPLCPQRSPGYPLSSPKCRGRSPLPCT